MGSGQGPYKPITVNNSTHLDRSWADTAFSRLKVALGNVKNYAPCMTHLPQSRKTTQRVSELLNDPDSSLSNLLKRARYLRQLEIVLTDLLEADLKAQFQVAAARKNRLILISPSASWATRLRMQAPRLISSLQAAGARQIEHIDIRVAPLV